MTQYTCTNCSTSFSLDGAGESLRCPKCGAEVAERLPDELEEAAQPAAAPSPATARRASGVPARKRSTPGARAPRAANDPNVHAATGRSKATQMAALFAVGVIAAVAVWVFGSREDASSDASKSEGTPPAVASPGETAPGTPLPASGNPIADFKARHDALSPGDLAGRLTLVEFCREHDLADQRLTVLREVLLLDSENEAARKSLGFTKHATAGSPFEGRWLTKAELELATAYDSLLAK